MEWTNPLCEKNILMNQHLLNIYVVVREYNDQRYEIIILTSSDRLIAYVIELNKLDESMAKLYIVC